MPKLRTYAPHLDTGHTREDDQKNLFNVIEHEK